MNGAFVTMLAAETGAEMRQNFRAPEFLIPTLALPVIFYLLFGITLSRGGSETATYLLATYGVFAVMGPALFGFGAGVAAEREKGWLRIKRVSPAPGASYVLAKLMTTLVFGAMALAPIYLAAGFLGGVALPRIDWLLLLGTHLLSVLPFSLLGLAIGFSFGSGAAIAFANIAFLGLAVLGGLWFPIMLFPSFMQQLAAWLPSFHLAEIGLSIVAGGDRPVGMHLTVIAISTLVLGALALWRWSIQR
ncbi:MAG: ABC transporter permease [Pseudomonadota bacterium]